MDNQKCLELNIGAGCISWLLTLGTRHNFEGGVNVDLYFEECLSIAQPLHPSKFTTANSLE